MQGLLLMRRKIRLREAKGRVQSHIAPWWLTQNVGAGVADDISDFP